MIQENTLDSLARLFKLLSDANRLRIIFVIGKGKKSVTEIMSETSLPQTLVSFHLRPLRESGLVQTDRKGPFIYYSLSEPVLIELLMSLCGVNVKGEMQERDAFICPPMSFMRQWLK
jgi:DNA-binding transcriptional ArsR family regulator